MIWVRPTADVLAANTIKPRISTDSHGKECVLLKPMQPVRYAPQLGRQFLTGKTPARLHLTDWIPGEPVPDHSRFRLPDWQQALPLEEETLAEALKKLGYRTGLIGKWHLGGPGFSPQDHGFDLNVGGGEIGHPASYFWPYGKAMDSHRVPGLAEAGGRQGEYLTDRLTEEALRFIEKNRDQPFYLHLAHYAVHSPLMAKPEDVDRFATRPGANEQSNAVYAAMLKSVDESVARVLQKLDDLQLAQHTVVIFTSDNGGAVHFGQPPATSNRPLRLGKGYPYEGGLRVPLLIRAPGMTKPGAISDVPVSSCDFFPTLLDLAGAKCSDSRMTADGVSLAPVLSGRSAQPHSALFWHYPHYWNGGKVTPYSVARVGDWKLIRFYEEDREELYNLRKDPSETRDLAIEQPARHKEMTARLNRWLKQVGAQMPVPR